MGCAEHVITTQSPNPCLFKYPGIIFSWELFLTRYQFKDVHFSYIIYYIYMISIWNKRHFLEKLLNQCHSAYSRNYLHLVFVVFLNVLTFSIIQKLYRPKKLNTDPKIGIDNSSITYS